MKKRRGLKVFLCILAILALFIATVNVIPSKKVTDVNPFLKGSGNLPMIAAHRGGGISNPDDMLFLTERDVDAIMTDDPKLLKEILNEYKK